jgi:hypothetical protein
MMAFETNSKGHKFVFHEIFLILVFTRAKMFVDRNTKKSI